MDFTLLHTYITNVFPKIILHGATTFAGDSGSPLLLDESGRIIAMHIAQVNKVPSKPPATPKRKRSGDAQEDDLRSSLGSSSNSSTAHLGEAVRIDAIRAKLVEACTPEQLILE